MAVADTIAVTFAMSLGPVIFTELVQEDSIRGWLYLYVNIHLETEPTWAERGNIVLGIATVTSINCRVTKLYPGYTLVYK
jgi:hypothetical protein